MAKIGQIVSIPTGSYCTITLDSGEKIVVNHEPGQRGSSLGPKLTVDRVRFLGLSSEPLARIALDTDEGQAQLAELRAEGPPEAAGSPLHLLVAQLHKCPSAADVVALCARLGQRGSG